METANARAIISKLRAREGLPPLAPARPWDAALGEEIGRLADGPLKSALFLWNDDLARCHELAQEIPTPLGSYLHGVMHRRERDYGNSKYWFRRVGDHPLFEELRSLKKDWDPFRMADWCEAAERDGALRNSLEALQRRELEGLADLALGEAEGS